MHFRTDIVVAKVHSFEIGAARSLEMRPFRHAVSEPTRQIRRIFARERILGQTLSHASGISRQTSEFQIINESATKLP
jgi:hypothetical protein